jgi:hypothetical protein
LNDATGVAVDAAGDNFIADGFDGVVREVSGSLSVATVSIATSADSLIYGQALTLTATVSGSSYGGDTPTGTVEFFDGTTVLGSAVLNAAGEATLTTSTLPVGQHDIMVLYLGDCSYFAGISAALPVTVTGP